MYQRIKNGNENRIFLAKYNSFSCSFQNKDFQTCLKYQIFKSHSKNFQDLISKCHRPTNILTPLPAHILNHRMRSGQNRNNASNERPCRLTLTRWGNFRHLTHFYGFCNFGKSRMYAIYFSSNKKMLGILAEDFSNHTSESRGVTSAMV